MNQWFQQPGGFRPPPHLRIPVPRSRRNIRPGGCDYVEDCEITFELVDEPMVNRKRLYGCRHNLAERSKYFTRVFQGEEKEKCIDNTIKIANISRINLLLFLRTTANGNDLMAIPELNRYVSGLITLAGRFESDHLADRITQRITGISFGACASKTKMMMLKAADGVKDKCPNIMANCVRLGATLKCHQIASLHNQISVSTMASIFVLRYEFYFKPPLCTITRCRNASLVLKPMTEYQSRRFGKNGKWTHPGCYGKKRVGVPPTIFELLKLPVDTKLMLDQSKWCEIT